MFDEKYNDFVHNHNKPMDTLEDAIMYLVGKKVCGSCSLCPAQMYEDVCSEKWEEAIKIATNALGNVSPESEKDIANEILYTYLFEKKQKANPKDARCDQCAHSFMRECGIRWCKRFGNFVHENGYCYRYEPSDKMEEKPVDN